MEMVRNQSPRISKRPGFANQFAQPTVERITVITIEKIFSFSIPPGHYVMNGPSASILACLMIHHY
jgi:hypothetical protein